MTMHLAMPFEMKAVGSEKSGKFEGYASTRKLDSDRDIVMPGAFKRTIDHHKDTGLALLWFHDPTQPIGGLKLLGEDEKGLVVEGECDLDIQRGAEVYSGMVKKYIDRMSIGYLAKRHRYDRTKNARLLDEVALREVSMITKMFAANDEALVTSLKSASATIRQWVSQYGDDTPASGTEVSTYVCETDIRDLIDSLSLLLGSAHLTTTKDSTGPRTAHPADASGSGPADIVTLIRSTTKALTTGTGSPDEAKAADLLRDAFAALR